MAKIRKKKRFHPFIDERTYNKVNDFVRTNELISSKLTIGTLLEIGLNMFFKELETRPLEEIAVEYLTGGCGNE